MNLIQTKTIDFFYATNQQDLNEVIYNIKNTNLIGCDTEIYGNYEKYGELASWKDPHTSLVRLLQLFSLDWEHPIVIDVLKIGIEETLPLIKEISDSRYRKIFHNAQYDLKQIRSTFGIWLENVWCTKVIMQRLGLCVGLKGSKIRKHTYASLAHNFFNIDISKFEQKSDWSNPDLSISQLKYSALDVAAPKSSDIKSILIEGYLNIKEALEKEYEVKEALEIDMRSVLTISKVEFSGMPISMNTFKAVMDNINCTLEKMRVEIAEILEYPISQNVVLKDGELQCEYLISDEVSKALNNPIKMVKRINEILYKGSLDSLTKEALKNLIIDLEEDDEDNKIDVDIIKRIIEYKKLVKMGGTDYLSMINPVTGCLHSNYQIIGASSGRMSSGKTDMGEDTFNAQQLSTVTITIPEIEDPFKSYSKRNIV